MKLVLNLMLAVSLVSVVGIEDVKADFWSDTRDLGLTIVTFGHTKREEEKRKEEEKERAAQAQRAAVQRERQIALNSAKEQLVLVNSTLSFQGVISESLNEVEMLQTQLLFVVENEIKSRIQAKELMVRALNYIQDMTHDNFELISLFYENLSQSTDFIRSATNNFGNNNMSEGVQQIEQAKDSLNALKLVAAERGKSVDSLLSEIVQISEKSDLEKIYSDLYTILQTTRSVKSNFEITILENQLRQKNLESQIKTLEAKL